jgi:alpha-tubulin suppressor-like RCC1 family protein
VLVGSGFASVAAGYNYSLAVKTNGDLYAWGSNAFGQLGDGTTTQRIAPVLVGSGFASVSGGYYHSLAVKTNGDLYAWGWNGSGALGDGTTTSRNAPVLVGSGFASAAAGYHHSLAVQTNGGLYAWGYNDFGQIGDGHGAMSLVVTAVPLPPKPDYLVYAATVVSASVGVVLTPDVPTWSGIASSFSFTPALPDGLTLDPATGVLSGTPTVASPATSYAVTATGPTGSTTGLLTIIVN